MRKYKRGEQIKTVADFDNCKSIWYIVYFGSTNPRTIHRAFLISWQYRTLHIFIERGWVFEAERRVNDDTD